MDTSETKDAKGLRRIWKDEKKRRLFLGCVIGGIALLALVGIGIANATNGNSSDDPTERNQVMESDCIIVYKVGISITAADWNFFSSPLIIHIQGVDPDNYKIDFYHAVTSSEAAEGTASIDLQAGNYTVSFISSINPDGSIYLVGSSQEIVVEEGTTDSAGTLIVGNFSKIEASEVTADQLIAILTSINSAIAKGDTTLIGTSGQAVADTAATNALANPNADAATIEQVKDETASAIQTSTTWPATTISGSSTGA